MTGLGTKEVNGLSVRISLCHNLKDWNTLIKRKRTRERKRKEREWEREGEGEFIHARVRLITPLGTRGPLECCYPTPSPVSKTPNVSDNNKNYFCIQIIVGYLQSATTMFNKNILDLAFILLRNNNCKVKTAHMTWFILYHRFTVGINKLESSEYLTFTIPVFKW